MKTEKKFCPKIRLYNYKGDLSKRWFIYWSENGQRVQKYKGINIHKTIGARTKAAKELISYWEKQLDQNVHGFGKTKYAQQYEKIQKFINSKKHSWRESTTRQTEGRMRIFFEWNKRALITRERIEEFLDYLYSTGRKQNTVGGYYLIMRNVIGNSLGEELFEGLHVKKGQGTPARYFSSGQVKFLSKKMAELDPELWLGVRFIYYCFIRPAELRLLKVGDVLLDDAKICVPADVSKNKKTQYVIIPEAFLEELNEALLGRNPANYILGDDYKPIGKNWLKVRHQKLLKELHFDTKQYKLYSWKHTGAVMASKSGVNLKQLQLQLRHHSLDQVNAYLRQMGVFDMGDFSSKMPGI